MENTVTSAASVPAIDFEVPAPGSKGYEEWRKTGKLPESDDSASPEPVEAEEVETPEVEQEIEHEETAEPAAAPAAAKPQGKKKDAAARLQEVLAERKKDRELIEKLLAKIAEPASAEPKSRTAAAEETKPEAKARPKRPKLGDVVDGKPAFKTYAEFEAAVEKYEDDLSEWNRGEILRQFEERSTKTQQSQQAAEADKEVMKVWTGRVQEARKTHADYDDVMKAAVAAKDDFGRDLIFLPKGSAPDSFLQDSDLGSEILYYIGQHVDAVKHIFERDEQGKFVMNPIRQVRELSKIEALIEQSLAKPAPKVPPARTATAAPRPPHQVSGKGPTPDPLAKAVEEGDQAAYTRLENEKAIAKIRERRGRR